MNGFDLNTHCKPLLGQPIFILVMSRWLIPIATQVFIFIELTNSNRHSSMVSKCTVRCAHQGGHRFIINDKSTLYRQSAEIPPQGYFDKTGLQPLFHKGVPNGQPVTKG